MITTKSGICILVHTLYYIGKNTGSGRKKKRNKGFYPGLLLFGIHDHCTPGLISEIGATVAAACSFEEAKDTLFRNGIEVDVKTIRDLAYRMAQRARALQQASVINYGEDLQGLRVASVAGRSLIY